jgi:VIT1/CCC1 family predicted Fe2+/Mn2+ transporter
VVSKESVDEEGSQIEQSAQDERREAASSDWTQVAFESSILGALLGLAVFLLSTSGIAATAGMIVGGVVFLLGMVSFASWKGRAILGIPLLGAVAGIVGGTLSSVF